ERPAAPRLPIGECHVVRVIRRVDEDAARTDVRPLAIREELETVPVEGCGGGATVLQPLRVIGMPDPAEKAPRRARLDDAVDVPRRRPDRGERPRRRRSSRSGSRDPEAEHRKARATAHPRRGYSSADTAALAPAR